MMSTDIDESLATLLFKYIVIGDVAVGKTCLLTQFIERKFRESYQITIGVEFNTKIIKLQIWDTVIHCNLTICQTGQENFKSVTRLYYRAAAGAIMVYDITRRDTFKSILEWHNEAMENGNPQMQFLLVGRVIIDEKLFLSREVTFEEGQEFANEYGMEFLEASAKNGDNVEDAFLKLSLGIYDKFTSNQLNLSENQGIKILKQQGSKKNGPLTTQGELAKNSDRTQEETMPRNTKLKPNIEFCEEEYEEYFNGNGRKGNRPQKQLCQCCSDQ